MLKTFRNVALSSAIAFAVAPALYVGQAQAAGISDYLENELLDHLFRDRAFSAPATICVGLLTAAPDDADTGATVTEASWTNYARGELAPSVSNWEGSGGETTATDSAGTSGKTQNKAVITFGTTPGSGPTVVTHIAGFDSCTIGAGNMLWYADITDKTVNSGDAAPTFPIDSLDVTITD